jgi:hypothetical protein
MQAMQAILKREQMQAPQACAPQAMKASKCFGARGPFMGQYMGHILHQSQMDDKK